MCGILGQVNKHENVEKELFSSMLDTLEKRGPDQKGCFFDGKIALGHRRLSVLDLSDAGRQPMFSEDEKISIIFNGEIYNYREIKKELTDCQWKSKTDTEVLLQGYKKWGQEISQHIEGMFSFAVYDKDKEILTLSRDHFGKKPLYYYLDDEIFCFASEIKAIIKNQKIKEKLKVDRLSLAKYLFYGYIPSPNSIFDGIKKMPPATTFQFDIRNWEIINQNQYWNLENIELNDELGEKQILEKTEELLKKSVEKRLMSDVPLGIFLSGGVDSSLVAAYMPESSSPVNSFTIGYKNYPEADESKYAQRVAKKMGFNHNLCYLESSLVRENFLAMMDYLDEPLADAATVPLYFISKFSKNKITVAMTGDGGDELFGGYPKYQAQEFIERRKYLSFLALIGKNIVSKNSPYYKLLNGFNWDFPARQFIFGSGSFLPKEVEALLNNENLDMKRIFEEAIKYEKMFKQNDIINKSLFLDSKIQLPDWYLAKSDRASMAASLEMRSPLLDKNLAEFAFSLRGSWKIKNGTGKYILKKIAEKYFDRDIIYREKMGFSVPLNRWIKNELKDVFFQYLFLENGFFNQKYIEKIYQEHMSGKRNHEFKLLRIFGFNYWYKNIYK